MTTSVVVGIDGSAASLAATDVAADEAQLRGTDLLVVHCAPEQVPPQAGVRGERLLALASERAQLRHPGLEVRELLLFGDPVDALISAAHDACLLVVGHGDHGSDAGRTATRVAERSVVPVLVHHDVDAAPSAAQPVLVGVCPATGSEEVVGFAFAEAAIRGAGLFAMHVAGHACADGDPTETVINDSVASWAAKYPAVAVTQLTRHGVDVPVPLIAASRAAQLVVVGASSHVDTHGAAPASVSRFLVRRAHCSVAVVPRARAAERPR